MNHCQKKCIVFYITIVIEKLCTYTNAEENQIKSKLEYKNNIDNDSKAGVMVFYILLS